MKKTLLIAGALLALTAGMASAAGVNLSWTDCGSFGVSNQANPCTANTSQFTLFCSVVVGNGVDAAVAQESVIDVQTSAPALSPWWQMKTGGCRPTSVSAGFGPFPGSCLDAWNGQALGGYAYDYAPAGEGITAANRARIRTVCAQALASATPMNPGDEFTVCTVSINKAKSVGAGLCAGCSDAACFVLNSIKLTQPAGDVGGDPTYTAGVNSQFATYNSGTAFCGQTPTQNRTWGQVKSLYR